MKFTLRKKGFASLICGGAVLVWLILWTVFPMPYYSLFFASNIGSNILLACLGAVMTFPINWLFSKILRTDINVKIHLVINIVTLLGIIYVFSIYRYTAVWLVIIAFAVYIAVCGLLFLKGKQEDVPRIKEKKSHLSLFLAGAACGAVTACLYVLFTVAMLHVFTSGYNIYW